MAPLSSYCAVPVVLLCPFHTLSCPAHSCPALYCSSWPCLAVSCFALPCPVLPCHCFALRFPALPFPDPALLCLVLCCAVLPLSNLAGVGNAVLGSCVSRCDTSHHGIYMMQVQIRHVTGSALCCWCCRHLPSKQHRCVFPSSLTTDC